ncbi:LCP family protein [Pedococcus sp. NPDC057267]|uniref:LCP family protein n=1 Tax=Pedococcus sp. NPDC057267 TaxID=3346077 RepID=UPI0036285DDE
MHEDDGIRAIPQGRPPRPLPDDEDVVVVDTRRRAVPGGRGGPARGRSGAAGREPAPRDPHGGGGSVRNASPRGRGPGPSRRARRARAVLLLGLVLVVAWVAFMVWVPFHAWGSVHRVDASPTGTQPPQTKGYDYLLVGSDSRAGLTAAQKKALTTGSADGQRTDSIILVHVPSDGGKPAFISIPRDSFVPIPGHRSNKINAAYSMGGPKLLEETVEQATGLRLDGYVEIGFGGFAGVVDAVGGVDICVPFNMDDPHAGINLKKGCQTLNGPNALGYVRARYSDPRGDIGRAERQRQFLGAIMRKALTPSTVLVPTRYYNFSMAAGQGLTVDQDTSLQDVVRVLQAMRAISKGEGLSLVVPLSSVNYPTYAGSAVKWDTPRAKKLFTMLRDDVPLEAPPEGTDGKPSGG